MLPVRKCSIPNWNSILHYSGTLVITASDRGRRHVGIQANITQFNKDEYNIYWVFREGLKKNIGWQNHSNPEWEDAQKGSGRGQ